MKANKPEVICIGQAVVDCIVKGAQAWEGLPAARAESITLSIGGDAVNESIAITQLGHSAAPMIAVGEDIAGDILRKEIRKHGVVTDLIRVMPEPFATPVANLIVDEGGGRRSLNAPATRLEGYAPDAAQIRGAKVVSLASLCRAPFDSAEKILSIAKAAKESGAVVCADMKLPTFETLSMEDLAPALPYIDYIFPNEKEAAYYTREDDYRNMAERFAERGVGAVIIKAGPEGCRALSGGDYYELPALPVEAVDTTGAGDHFVAGFIAGLLEEKSFGDCLLQGRAVATESIQYPGGITPVSKPENEDSQLEMGVKK